MEFTFGYEVRLTLDATDQADAERKMRDWVVNQTDIRISDWTLDAVYSEKHDEELQVYFGTDVDEWVTERTDNGTRV